MFDDLVGLSYKWEPTQDCYGLLKKVRARIFPSRQQLPNYDFVYYRYTRKSVPPTLINTLLIQHNRSTSIDELEQVGDIALVLGNYGGALVTYLGEELVIGFGMDGLVEIMPIAALKILSCWRLE